MRLRPFLVGLSVLLSLFAIANATTYYVAANGDDNNAGTSMSSPWRTLLRASSFRPASNDRYLLRRGDIFYGQLTINTTTGDFIYIGSYGTATLPQPIISGSIRLPSNTVWQAYGTSGNVYRTNLATLMRGYNLAQNPIGNLYVGDVQQTLARWPNNIGDTPDSWAFVTSYDTVNRVWTTSNSLTATRFADGYFNGATYHIRENSWMYSVGTVFNYQRLAAGGRFSMSSAYTTANLSPYGFFFDNILGELDYPGEYYWDPVGLYLYYYPPNGQSDLSQTFDLAYYSYGVYTFDIGNNATINDLHFQYQSNTGIMVNGRTTGFSVTNCFLENIGITGINTGYIMTGGSLSNNIIQNIGGQGILTSHASYVNINSNTITNIGLMVGNPAGGITSAYQGINGGDLSYCNLKNNFIQNIAGQGMELGGSALQLLVENNVIDSTMLYLSDGGAIYLGSGVRAVTGSMIIGNTLTRCMGSGTSSNVPVSVFGVYFDGGGGNLLYNNTVSVTGSGAFKMSNNPNNIVVGNSFTNTPEPLVIVTDQVLEPWGNILACNYMSNSGGGGIFALPKNLPTWASMRDNYYCSTSPMWFTISGSPVKISSYSILQANSDDEGSVICTVPYQTWSCSPANYVTNPTFLSVMADDDAVTMQVTLAQSYTLFSTSAFVGHLASDLGVPTSRITGVSASSTGTGTSVSFIVMPTGARGIATAFYNKLSRGQAVSIGATTSFSTVQSASSYSITTQPIPTYTGSGISVCTFKPNSIASFHYWIGTAVDAPDWQSCCNLCGAMASCTLFQFNTALQFLRGNCQLSNQNALTPTANVYWNVAVGINSGVPTTRGTTPVVRTTGVQTTAIQTTGVQTTGVQTTGVQLTPPPPPPPTVRTTGVQTTGIQTTGVQTTGIQTTGIQNAGMQTTGVQNTPVNGNPGYFYQTIVPSILSQRYAAPWTGNVLGAVNNVGTAITTGTTDYSLTVIDGIYTYVSMPDSTASGILSASNFSVNFPSDGRFTGMTITLRGRGLVSNRARTTIVLQVGGSNVGACTRNCQTGYWPTVDTTYTWGSPADLWGLTTAQVTDPTFSVGFQIVNGNVVNANWMDFLSITIYYYSPSLASSPVVATTGVQTTGVQTTGIQVSPQQPQTTGRPLAPSPAVRTYTQSKQPSQLSQDWNLNGWSTSDTGNAVSRSLAANSALGSQDGTFAFANVTAGAFTAPLNVAGFGFTIPSSATITSITATFSQSSTWFNTVFYNQLGLQLGGVALGTCLECSCLPARSDEPTVSLCSAYWPGGAIQNFRDYSYGTDANSWSVSVLPAPSTVNSATFGVKIQLSGNINAYRNVQAQLDKITVTVTYTASGAGDQTAGEAFLSNSAVGRATIPVAIVLGGLIVLAALTVVAVLASRRKGGPHAVLRKLGFYGAKTPTADIPVIAADSNLTHSSSAMLEAEAEPAEPAEPVDAARRPMTMLSAHRTRLAGASGAGLNRSTDKLMASNSSIGSGVSNDSPVSSPLMPHRGVVAVGMDRAPAQLSEELSTESEAKMEQ